MVIMRAFDYLNTSIALSLLPYGHPFIRICPSQTRWQSRNVIAYSSTL